MEQKYVCKYKTLKINGMNEVIFKIFKLLPDKKYEDITESVFSKVQKYAETATIGDYTKSIRLESGIINDLIVSKGFDESEKFVKELESRSK